MLVKMYGLFFLALNGYNFRHNSSLYCLFSTNYFRRKGISFIAVYHAIRGTNYVYSEELMSFSMPLIPLHCLLPCVFPILYVHILLCMIPFIIQVIANKMTMMILLPLCFLVQS